MWFYIKYKINLIQQQQQEEEEEGIFALNYIEYIHKEINRNINIYSERRELVLVLV